jgi:hypothetical protein
MCATQQNRLSEQTTKRGALWVDPYNDSLSEGGKHRRWSLGGDKMRDDRRLKS